MASPLKRLALTTALAAMTASPALADLVVVAHPKSGVERLNRSQVINIFLGRFRQLPGGAAAQPIDLPAEHGERTAFYRQLVNKEPAEIASYWSRLVFSGGMQPPRSASGPDNVLALVAVTPGALGYIDRSRVDARVRIVFDFNE